MCPTAQSDAPAPAPVPVTLLSGFLGAGKTTLLKSVLEQTHSNKTDQALKVAVLVNDMAEVNIDASMVSNTKMLQQEEAKMVELHNGCICCTLRGDLVKAVSDLAAEGKFDAIVIESTGVSVPMEVAETFMADVPPEAAKSGDPELKTIIQALRGKSSLNEAAPLDTCVTLVDCAAFGANMATAAELGEQFEGSADEGDNRSVGPLLMSQIEFADVIVLSKCDLISNEAADSVERAVRALNPSAKLIRAVRGNVPLSSVLRTGLFSMENAPGWLQQLDSKEAHVPETEEYGIDSFVYKARTPFHPLKLMKFLDSHFMVRFPDLVEVKEAPVDEFVAAVKEVQPADGKSAGDKATAPKEKPKKSKKPKKSHPTEEELARTRKAAKEAELRERESDAKEKTARMRHSFGHILRSKGFVWLAGRDSQVGEWSQAGAVGQFNCGGGWMASLPPQFWPPPGSEEHGKVMKDFQGPVLQDRRQCIVFIGQKLKQDAITHALDACLLTVEDLLDKGEHVWKLGVRHLPDPFPPWRPLGPPPQMPNGAEPKVVMH
mmetsp:Transcript_14301/g.44690  ORF Transcript_14301/g.44690 Transcript_14301/m.44690 type:complete len:547 (-) Transcript_14301:103-1743(-)